MARRSVLDDPVFDWTTTAARRLAPGNTAPQGAAAAAHWRNLLDAVATN